MICRYLLLLGATLALPTAAQTAAPKPTAPPAVSLYLEKPPLDFRRILLGPPAPGSTAAKADLAAVHSAQDSRKPEQVLQAQLDDHEEDIFIFSSVLGPRFSASELPLTAAFSLHLRHESSVVNPALKKSFARPRPYLADKTVHPVCDLSAAESYPSGHAMVGYLEAFALAQIVPEQSEAILARAAAFASNRILCGAHYPTDVEASRTVSLALFGALATSPAFQKELAAARAETRKHLGLPAP